MVSKRKPAPAVSSGAGAKGSSPEQQNISTETGAKQVQADWLEILCSVVHVISVDHFVVYATVFRNGLYFPVILALSGPAFERILTLPDWAKPEINETLTIALEQALVRILRSELETQGLIEAITCAEQGGAV